jgi:NAD(P)-dependent dehydrogenase (short-subunit alcohol dehydrogenase family)
MQHLGKHFYMSFQSQSPMPQEITTLRFLQAGASKVYITSRKAAACESAVAALNALPNLTPGAKAISVPADSAKIEGVEHLVKEVMKTTDHVDILFANAGATWGEAFDTHPDSAFAKVMDLNVKSVFNTIRLWVLILNCSKIDLGI